MYIGNNCANIIYKRGTNRVLRALKKRWILRRYLGKKYEKGDRCFVPWKMSRFQQRLQPWCDWGMTDGMFIEK